MTLGIIMSRFFELTLMTIMLTTGFQIFEKVKAMPMAARDRRKVTDGNEVVS